MNPSELTILREINTELESALRAALDDANETSRGLTLEGLARSLGKLDFLLNKNITRGETK